jgi:hypothetical protein
VADAIAPQATLIDDMARSAMHRAERWLSCGVRGGEQPARTVWGAEPDGVLRRGGGESELAPGRCTEVGPLLSGRLDVGPQRGGSGLPDGMATIKVWFACALAP